MGFTLAAACTWFSSIFEHCFNFEALSLELPGVRKGKGRQGAHFTIVTLSLQLSIQIHPTQLIFFFNSKLCTWNALLKPRDGVNREYGLLCSCIPFLSFFFLVMCIKLYKTLNITEIRWQRLQMFSSVGSFLSNRDLAMQSGTASRSPLTSFDCRLPFPSLKFWLTSEGWLHTALQRLGRNPNLSENQPSWADHFTVFNATQIEKAGSWSSNGQTLHVIIYEPGNSHGPWYFQILD